jgi:hypothetical protein
MTCDPVEVARCAMTINQAFETGAAEHSLNAHGRWSTTINVNGTTVPLEVLKKRW